MYQIESEGNPSFHLQNKAQYSLLALSFTSGRADSQLQDTETTDFKRPFRAANPSQHLLAKHITSKFPKVPSTQF